MDNIEPIMIRLLIYSKIVFLKQSKIQIDINRKALRKALEGKVEKPEKAPKKAAQKKLEAKYKKKKLKVFGQKKLERAQITPEIQKISSKQAKEAMNYTRSFKPEKVKKMVSKSYKTSIYDLWRGGALRKAYESEKDPNKKKKLEPEFNQGYAEMTAQFTKLKKDSKGRTFFEVDLKGVRKLEDHVGAAHIVDSKIKKVAIMNTRGEFKIGYRKIPGEGNITGIKIGYYTKSGEYLPVFSGYRIYPLELFSPQEALLQAKKEQEYYEKNKTRLKKESKRQYLEISKFEDKEVRTGKYFNRSLTLVETKDGQKYWHIVTRANEDPSDGVREMGSHWNERRALKWAKDLEKRFGVPALNTLATAIFESGRGHNRLSYQLNNYFGIKPWWRLKASMKRIVRSKYPNYRILGDFRDNEKQDHMHYADAWSSFYRYAQLVSRAGRYRHCMKFKDNPIMFSATVALSGYCPSETYIRKISSVIRRVARKHGMNAGYIDYPVLKAHMAQHNPSKLSKEQLNARLEPARRSGYVRGMPA